MHYHALCDIVIVIFHCCIFMSIHIKRLNPILSIAAIYLFVFLQLALAFHLQDISQSELERFIFLSSPWKRTFLDSNSFGPM